MVFNVNHAKDTLILEVPVKSNLLDKSFKHLYFPGVTTNHILIMIYHYHFKFKKKIILFGKELVSQYFYKIY